MSERVLKQLNRAVAELRCAGPHVPDFCQDPALWSNLLNEFIDAQFVPLSLTRTYETKFIYGQYRDFWYWKLTFGERAGKGETMGIAVVCAWLLWKTGESYEVIEDGE